MTRIMLFLGTNIAVLAVLSFTMRLFGIDGMLDAQGGLDTNSLLIMAAIMGFSGSIISLLISKWTAKRLTGAQVIQQPRNRTEQWLLDTVARQAKQAGIGMPEVAIYNAPEPNAFATGANRNNALVAVSTGLMQAMTEEEVEAVLAHEVSHIANGDMVTMALIQGVVNTFVIFLSRVVGHLVDRVVFKTENGHGPAFWITSIIAELVLGILASIIVMWFSRQREYRADAGAASLVGAPKMIAALKRLAGTSTEPLPDQLHAFGISGGRGGLSALFMTHPPLASRIEALQQ
ncbi:protease htpX-like protein [Methylophaga frappieri]|uniref:Protease HtpX n=1 Tax=Methylophaga frappieri (strain ATCC BAA-2434 / DSM 25690 / JAM7) TaxID=754477 RepID=I1YK89_METFJ|nr:protease HtpX [Methylophaga frappieri]AFJ03332.1 protease htpX-like protein [Methylophaga frappieri]